MTNGEELESNFSNRMSNFFAKYSILSERQIEALEILRRKNRLSKDDYILDGRKVTKGAFYRVVAQARENMKKTIYTLLFLTYQDILKEEDIETLFAFVNMLKMNKISEEKEEKIIKEVEIAIEKIVKEIIRRNNFR